LAMMRRMSRADTGFAMRPMLLMAASVRGLCRTCRDRTQLRAGNQGEPGLTATGAAAMSNEPCVEFIVGSSGCVGYTELESIPSLGPSVYRPTVEDELEVRDDQPRRRQWIAEPPFGFVAEIPAVDPCLELSMMAGSCVQ